MRRTALLLALALPWSGGCVYCLYPRIDSTPAVRLDVSADEVRAFRVDRTHDAVFFLGSLVFPEAKGVWEWHCSSSGEMTPLHVGPDGAVPAQSSVTLSCGFVVTALVVNVVTHTSHSMSVVLYRPGYELAEVAPWPWGGKVAWKPAPDVRAQESALKWLESHLGKGDISHFLAGEYERLSREATGKEDQKRLAFTALLLRNNADGQRPKSHPK